VCSRDPGIGKVPGAPGRVGVMGLPVMSTYRSSWCSRWFKPQTYQYKKVVYPYYGIYSAKKVPTHATTWMKFENMLNERSQTQRSHLILFTLCNISKVK
jgi:hypothetical protein